MKKIYLSLFLLTLLVAIQGCKKELPFPLDDVKRGVAIDIVRVPNTDGTISNGLTTGNYKVKLTIPTQQGDYSFMKNAQLVAVLQDLSGKLTSKVVEDNITEFPKEITINLADVYNKFGLKTPTVGEVVYFTTNVILNDGTVIPGWTKEIGFNNKAFAGWIIDNRAYSYNVRYAVVCPLVLNDFVGTNTVTLDEWSEEVYPVEITKVSDTKLSIAGLLGGVAASPLVITINPVDYSITFDKQVLVPNSGSVWWNPARPTYNNFALSAGKGTVDACHTILQFTGTATVDAGSFGPVNFKIEKNPK